MSKLAYGDEKRVSGGLFGKDYVIREGLGGQKTIHEPTLFGNAGKEVGRIEQGFFGANGVSIRSSDGTKTSISPSLSQSALDRATTNSGVISGALSGHSGSQLSQDIPGSITPDRSTPSYSAYMGGYTGADPVYPRKKSTNSGTIWQNAIKDGAFFASIIMLGWIALCLIGLIGSVIVSDKEGIYVNVILGAPVLLVWYLLFRHRE